MSLRQTEKTSVKTIRKFYNYFFVILQDTAEGKSLWLMLFSLYSETSLIRLPYGPTTSRLTNKVALLLKAPLMQLHGQSAYNIEGYQFHSISQQ